MTAVRGCFVPVRLCLIIHGCLRLPVPNACRTSDLGAVLWLLVRLREIGADRQVTALLARDPATHVALDDAYFPRVMLDCLLRAGADQQVTALVDRFPNAGHFDFFMGVGDHKKRFRFGREPDATAAAPWGWDDLE
jgi:hypothetical protein